MPKAFRDFWPGSAYSLAKKAAVPEQTVRDLMKGRTEFSRMSVANAIKLAEAMNTTVDALYKRIYNF
jgi:plasmid maintenance system antidote protein VapI